VNYKEKVKALQQNGVLNEDQARRLSDSFEESSTNQELPTQRKYTLEVAGGLLILFAGIYMAILLSMGNDAATVESTKIVLNSPATSGLHSSNSFVMILLVVAILIYLLIYLLAHNRYNTLWRADEQKRGLYRIIHNGEVMRVALGSKLEELLQAQNLNDKESRADMQIKIDAQNSPAEYLMRFYTELEEEIRSYKNQLAILETKCTQQQNRFPNNLARLVGKPPQCK
jgi:hypothetical protein